MAAYEVLLLNTAIPQIQAAQSGDTYVVPRDIAINATAIISANSATDALRITQTGAGNALVVEDSANPDSSPFVVTAAGDVGIGVASPATKLDVFAGATGAWHRFEANAVNESLYSNYSAASGYQTMSLAASTFRFFTGAAGGGSATEKMRLDSSGNLGLGVTPEANWRTDFNAKAFQIRLGALSSFNDSNLDLSQNAYLSSGGWRYIASAAASQYTQSAGAHAWYRSTSAQVAGTDPVFSQAMTLDALGNLGLGATTTTGGRLVITQNNSVQPAIYLPTDESTIQGPGADTQIRMGSNLTLQSSNVTNINAKNASGYISLGTGSTPTERARITSGGDVNCGVAGTNAGVLYIQTGTGGTTGRIIDAVDALGARYFEVQTDGDVYNTNGTYGTISDQRLKQDIVDAGSQWDDLKAIRFRKYRMKADVAANPDAPALLGVVAQELEQTSPGLVDEHADKDAEGNDLGTTTKSVKTSVLLMKAAVALQEAMARIEKLEAEVAALKGA